MNTTARYDANHSDGEAHYDEFGTGSVCGPEYYAGGEWSRRHVFSHADGTWTVVTEYAAVINGYELHNRDADEDDPRPYIVEEVTEMTDCTDPTDPGGTEISSATHRGEGSHLAYATVAEAEAEAKRFGSRMSHEYFEIPDHGLTILDHLV